ncbi:MAG: magnesium protoporphyrin IX methyltransferase [Pseudomonadota bacterium]
MANTTSYTAKRAQLETYFDKTASEAWAKLTSDAPVSGIRATVRAGRDAMRDYLLEGLPEDLSGQTVLDAGCGPGQLSIALAARGANVTAVDLSATLLELASERIKTFTLPGTINFHVGDFSDEHLGEFDHFVAMDSLIHYEGADILGIVDTIIPRIKKSLQFTIAPRTPLLSAMHSVGKLFPQSDRAPQIAPTNSNQLLRELTSIHLGTTWQPSPIKRVSSGFYICDAIRMVRT